MPSLPTGRRRRHESESDDEEQSESSNPSPPTSNKKRRLDLESTQGVEDNDDSQVSEDDEEVDGEDDSSEPPQTNLTNRDNRNGYANTVGPNGFKPGAIVRIKLNDFVTYSSAEFFPGPKLNMVIGPNGTGKSTLVCAICLGLGWGPQVRGSYM